MNTRAMNLPLRASVFAVQSALAVLALQGLARAADAEPTVADLTTPTNTVEVGAADVSAASAKASEYNGVRGKGLYGIGNFDLRGGGAYDSADTMRWRLKASDLGLEKRNVTLEAGEQGQYRIDLHYSELLRNRSDTFQTPYLGAGGDVFTLPAAWLVPLVPRVSGSSPNARGLSPAVTASSALVAGVLTAPTAAQTATANAIQAADLPAFHNANLSTKRTEYGLGMTYEIGRHWQANVSYSNEFKEGLKPMGTITAFTGGDISTILPTRIDQTTEQINLGVTYVGERLTFNTAYYGSLFVNDAHSMTWSNWASPGNAQTMSTAPNNQYHQFSASAVYALAPSTKLTGNLTYGRALQNDTFLTDSGTPLVPVSSLNGLVVTRVASLKLISRPVKDLSVSAGYKFDERDNRTPVNTYAFYDAGAVPSGTSVFNSLFPGLGSNSNINANRPYSKRLNQLNADASYAVAKGQAISAGAEYQNINRYCSGSWIECADADKTREGTLRAEWRLNPLEHFGARVGLSTAHRTVDYNEDAFLALVPAANLSPTGAPGGSTAYGTLTALGLTGYGPVLGLNPLPLAGSAQAFFFPNNNALANALYGNVNRISELPGMRRFNMADRNRDKLRSALNWQADEKISVQAGLDLNDDRYSNSVYGLQSAKSWALNLEGTYSPTEELTFSLYYSYEDQRSKTAGNSYTANSATANVGGFTDISGGCFATIALRNASNKIDPCLNWNTDMRDRVDTLGLTFARKRLVSGKLDVGGGLNWSQARSDIGVNGGNYANNPLAVAGAPAGTIAAFFIPATALPTVKTDTIELKLNLRYALSKQQAIRVGYVFQHMKSNDWAYDGMQFGGLSGVLPTNEQAFNYNVSTIAVAYVYSFR